MNPMKLMYPVKPIKSMLTAVIGLPTDEMNVTDATGVSDVADENDVTGDIDTTVDVTYKMDVPTNIGTYPGIASAHSWQVVAQTRAGSGYSTQLVLGQMQIDVTWC